MEHEDYQSWGRNTHIERQAKAWRSGDLNNASLSSLPFGNGRSYGDSCHNDQGMLLDNRAQSKVISFDETVGEICCEAGILLCDILRHITPTGWFLPVTPGTQFVTLGGAIANDVHGKNHHRTGTFGCHVESFGLERSDQPPLECSRQENQVLYCATIGGLGLTGNITSATIRLKKVHSIDIKQQSIKFERLGDYFDMAEEADRNNEYSVAWIDSLARGQKLGRGILLNGNHAKNGNLGFSTTKPFLSVPFTPPISLINGLALKAFNQLYYHKQQKREVISQTKCSSYFYPLDGIGKWNRLYGPKGLFQHQSVVPLENAEAVVSSLIKTTQTAEHGSFLTVLKRFGDVASPGFMSFPREGFTLTLDFPNFGKRTLALLNDLDRITINAGGAINPYKDARMSADTFKQAFPNWQELEALRDPAIMSDFWRRVAG